MRWKRQRTTHTATLDPAGSEERRLAKVAYLAETDPFRGMSNQELKQIERSTAMMTCTRGTVFYTPGETGEALFILKQGRVNLYRTTPDGRKFVTSTVERGTVFGEMSLIGQGMQESFAEAAEDCTLCVMSRTDVERLLRERPETALHLIEILTRRLAEAEAWLAEVAYKSVPSRIATTLLRLSGEQHEPVRLSHQDIADIVGTYRETATRLLNELRRGRDPAGANAHRDPRPCAARGARRRRGCLTWRCTPSEAIPIPSLPRRGSASLELGRDGFGPR